MSQHVLKELGDFLKENEENTRTMLNNLSSISVIYLFEIFIKIVATVDMSLRIIVDMYF